MNINLDQALVEVSPNKFLHIERAAGMTLLCVSGTLWVTRKNCMKDFELSPGESYTADSPQSITVCGFTPSIVRLFQPSTTKTSTALDAMLQKMHFCLMHTIKNLKLEKQ
jgi:hypothetical protein